MDDLKNWIWTISCFQGSIESYEDLDQFITPRENDHYSCGLCHMFRHRSTGSVRWHLESKHFPNFFIHHCPHCQAVLPTRRALDTHVKKEHWMIWCLVEDQSMNKKTVRCCVGMFFEEVFSVSNIWILWRGHNFPKKFGDPQKD